MNESAGANEQPENGGSAMVDFDATMQRLGNDRELLGEFIEIFLDDSPVMLEKFAAGLEVSDAKKIRESVHAIKGLASNFGAEPFCKLAQQIENAAAAGDVETCQQQMPTFLALFESLKAELVNLAGK
jgi:HPt (histidine-containing phosphotransfer) domain-containing protein